jgi:hypothetical protein
MRHGVIAAVSKRYHGYEGMKVVDTGAVSDKRMRL